MVLLNTVTKHGEFLDQLSDYKYLKNSRFGRHSFRISAETPGPLPEVSRGFSQSFQKIPVEYLD
jgi:hypothetical protein